IISSGDSPVGDGPTSLPGQPVPLVEAVDFDPVGGDGEHPELLGTVVDGNPSRTGGAWTTETYEVDFPDAKEGVGVYVVAEQPVAATDLEVRSLQPGWDLTVLAANEVPEEDPDDPLAGWAPVGSAEAVERLQQLSLDTGGTQFQNYLVWITDLADETDGHKVEITEIRLFD
ncbi:MAG TPA: hypothetical protein VFD37_07255, partial [Solirubrobacterales bacterium]|nr:hypothetical protein [Solirubrobacterales bacterium]